MNNINIYLVRHGQTYFNLYGRFQGWSDIELTKKGVADGHRSGHLLANIKFDAAYSSDLSRAVKTAEYILSENPHTTIKTPTTLPEFREQFFGSFEGTDTVAAIKKITQANHLTDIESFSELLTKQGVDNALNALKAADPYHDAENAAQFWTRIDAGFDFLRQAHPNGATILLVSHGSTIRSIAGHFGKKEYEGIAPENGSITKLTLTPDDVKVIFYSQTEQLPEA
ncbi:putative phosphoglycerate mutase [Weissella beninensis]|uniref:Histidine phosphatase family protein n=1 Tax=Periweissella beninensis TaxID=504936 RepID=A0ABT0VIJ4_9LACO|nr:histidine phosphatase family protein [Periweissella beninensis]MBM7543929.1 putative phosphoglycerate mutase [Periweissella beninensis]MCM2437655.1 histidine phosphatase family protein [Periweissella beninensis]